MFRREDVVIYLGFLRWLVVVSGTFGRWKVVNFLVLVFYRIFILKGKLSYCW